MFMLATFRRLRAACRVDTHPYIDNRDSRHQHILAHSEFQVIRSLAISARKRRQTSDESADAAGKRYTNLGCKKMNRSKGDLIRHDSAKWPLLTHSVKMTTRTDRKHSTFSIAMSFNSRAKSQRDVME